MTIRRAVLLLIIGSVGLCAWSCWRDEVAHDDFKRLLTGDKDIQLRTIEIELQRKRIIVDDSGTLNYLTKAFRFAKALRFAERGKAESSNSYDATVRLSTGAQVRCVLYVPEAKDHVTLYFPIDSVEDGVNYLVTLPEPVPKPLSDVLSQLRSPLNNAPDPDETTAVGPEKVGKRGRQSLFRGEARNNDSRPLSTPL